MLKLQSGSLSFFLKKKKQEGGPAPIAYIYGNFFDLPWSVTLSYLSGFTLTSIHSPFGALFRTLTFLMFKDDK
jgi:hypothetical protein